MQVILTDNMDNRELVTSTGTTAIVMGRLYYQENTLDE